MGRFAFVGLVVAGALVGVAPTVAAPPASVTISVVTTIGSDGAFTATGIDGCASGTTSDVVLASTHDSPGMLVFHALKTFTCLSGGGTGTFTVRINASAKPGAPTDSGTWTVTGGTGDYSGLKGSGSLVGTYFGGGGAGTAPGINDVLTGKVKL